ncbi:hypothetical protein CIW49_13750 [Mycolicibacterium sp. P1-18]|nr:hypothetical protein CIW49_13750 [Mycolicibacterium sp. P1-18]
MADGGSGDSTAGDQPSHAGVALMNEAVLDVRTRQSERIQFNAEDLVTGADAYDVTDSQAERRIANSM